MLRSGADYLAGLRDGRLVYLGKDKVEDVSEHPAFRNAARTIAALYDLKLEKTEGSPLSYLEDGEEFSAYYKMARTREDLEFRAEAHRVLARFHCGLMGRSLDYVSSFVTGMATAPEMFG